MSQCNLGSLVRAITASEIEKKVTAETRNLDRQISKLLRQFTRSEMSAPRFFEFENQLEVVVRQFCLPIVQWIVGTIEPKLRDMPRALEYSGKRFRQLREKSKRTNILSRFGEIEITRARYRNGRQGEIIFPLELLLGIERGFTPAAADMVGKQFAATGSSQGRTIEAIGERTGVTIGVEKLRGLVERLSSSLEPYREEAQVQRVIEMVEKARQSGGKPVLSVSRDAVSLGIAPWGYFEMASVACVSVMANGKRLGTVYLGRAPEENQRGLSSQLTSLLKGVLRRCGNVLPRIVYVTDAGKIETAYWENELKRFTLDGRRIPITRVVDYYHAAERLTVLADALKFESQKKRSAWLKHVRGLLLESNGHGRVLRSIASMNKRLGLKSSKADDAAKAEQYLRRYKPFMNYNQLKSSGLPIGSGVVESACKQIVSERMKLAGMRGSREGGQNAMTLRCLLLSKIWQAVYDKWLDSKPTVSDFTALQTV